jgi:prepilin-type N-terminal cleavage/methylation domain-containing protein/prepilin-type processing-associated H-X9-DG protein
MAWNGRTGSSRKWPTGFTLTELLVVVSLICLLMSLLLPALTHAQRLGEQTHCLGNQHQLILAWLQYAMDHDDLLFDPNSLGSSLQPYVQMREVFVCKSVAEGPMGRGRDSYGVSNTMGGKYRDGVQPYTKLHLVSRPTEKLVLIDTEHGSTECFWPLMLNRGRWMWRPWGGLQRLTARHNNGCNTAFADGHGEYTLWRDDRTRKFIKGLIASSEEASSDNPDLEHMVNIMTHGRNSPSTTKEARPDGP